MASTRTISTAIKHSCVSMIDGFKIFDIHIHVQPWDQLKPEIRVLMEKGRPKEVLDIMNDSDKLIKLMAREGIDKAALINYEAQEIMGFSYKTNVFCSHYCMGHREQLIPVGSINPLFSKNMNKDLDHLLADLGMKIFKIHPSHQGYYPNAYLEGDKNVRLIYEKALQYDVPVMVHTGTSIFKNARNKYAHPMHLEDVAIDFPDLKIIMAHGGRPLWMNEAFFLMRRFPNMYLDISSIPPSKLLEYFPRLEEIADRVLWGTDWPGPGTPSMGTNARQFLQLPLADENKKKILYDNAARLLNI